MATMDELPDLVIQAILLKLPLLDVFRLMRVNKTWYSVANIVVGKRGTKVDTNRYPGYGCCDPQHLKKDLFILQVEYSKLQRRDMEYILKKMGGGLEVWKVDSLCGREADEEAIICAGDFTPNLECLVISSYLRVLPPCKALPKLKHLYWKDCDEDFHRFDELFPSLEVLQVDYLHLESIKSLTRGARFRHGMTSISLPDIDLYYASQWPAIETLKSLSLKYPYCSRMFSFQAPLLEELSITGSGRWSEEYHESLVRSLVRCHSIKKLSLLLSAMNVNLAKELLAGLPQLIKISFDILIDDEAISIIQATANNIEEMTFRKASVTDLTLEHLKNLPKLKKVSFGLEHRKGFTVEGIRKFCVEMRQPDGKLPFDFDITQDVLAYESHNFEDFPNLYLRFNEDYDNYNDSDPDDLPSD